MHPSSVIRRTGPHIRECAAPAMKFGRYFLRKQLPAWEDCYVRYKLLNDIIKATVEGNSASVSENSEKHKVVVSLSAAAALSPASTSPPISGDFFDVLEADMKMVDAFSDGEAARIRREVSYLKEKVERMSGTTTAEEVLVLREDASILGNEFLKLESYANLNFMAIHKILKKHDKKLPQTPCRQLYISRLQQQRWVKQDYSKIFVHLSKIHSTLRGDGSGKQSDAGGQAFVRTTTKYWVRTHDISHVKHAVLQHLPVFQFNLDALHGDSQLTNSAYFDNDELDLYHERLDKVPGAIAIRLRWYASEEPSLVFVERKTHHDSWTGDASVKERFTLRESEVMSFLNGGYTVEDKMADMVAKGKSSEDRAEVRRLFTEIYEQIRSRNLKPMMRTQYMRVAYQIPFDATVRISMDTNLLLMCENSPSTGYDCMSEGRWFRDPQLPTPNTEVTKFPHAVLEVKLSLQENEMPPQWVLELIESGMLTEVHKFSKFIHGCCTLIPHRVRAVPYWVDDSSVRPSMLKSARSGRLAIGELPTFALMRSAPEIIESTQGGPDASEAGLSEKLGVWFGWFHDALFGPSDVIRPKKPRKTPMKVEPKVFFANERTFLSWVHMAVTIGTVAAALLSSGGVGAVVSGDTTLVPGDATAILVGAMLLPVSLFMLVYALMMFRWRSKLLKWKIDGDFYDKLGPSLLGWLLVGCFVVIFCISY